MKKPVEREDFQKDIVLKKCFDALTINGIEGISIRTFSEATGMTTSSLYYWFENKEDIIIDATVFGLNYIVEILFDSAITHMDNIEDLCNSFIDYISNYKPQLRLIIQVTTSPQYGKEMRKHIEKTSLLFDVYAQKVSAIINCPYDMARVIVDNFISASVDYIIWEDSSKAKRQMEYITYQAKNGGQI